MAFPTLTIPSATRHLSEVRRFVGERAAAAGLSERAVGEVTLAVDEACANAIEHAYGGRDDGTVTVETRHEAARFRVVIRHTGVPFDASRYQPVGVEEAAKKRRAGGFGVSLMRRLMDEVAYRERGGVSEVHLVKLLNGEGGAAPTA